MKQITSQNNAFANSYESAKILSNETFFFYQDAFHGDSPDVNNSFGLLRWRLNGRIGDRIVNGRS